MIDLDEFYGPNAGYAAELLEGQAATGAQASVAVDLAPGSVSAAAAAASLAQGIRLFGHRSARLDPLGSEPPGDPQLDFGWHGVRSADLARLPATVVGATSPVVRKPNVPNAQAAIAELERIYCGSSGFEFAHVGDPAERAWLLQAVEEERFRPPADPIDERELLDRLTEVSAFERFLHRAYPGQTRFSVEGLGILIPMLDELIARAAANGTRTILLGMAHRGRLNVLAHVLGKPYARILAEFEGRVPRRRRGVAERTDEGWAGDVKYHAGGRRVVQPEEDGAASSTVTVVMAPNPSHLEFVDPVVQGMTRAADEDRRRSGPPQQDEAASLGVLIHGDASFPGQGVVAETLNLSRLSGYRTGGTLHLITNNQLGFTTNPSEARSTLYASDLAKGFEIPIVHVNADDPVASLAAVRLAVAYRSEFGKDFLIDLVGYRRWGHNEGDDPSFTQPRMYDVVSQKPTVRELFAADLVQRNVVRAEEPDEFLKAGLDEFQRIRDGVRAAPEEPTASEELTLNSLKALRGNRSRELAMGPGLEELRQLNTQLLSFPNEFAVHPKLERSLARRRGALDGDETSIDWGHAETLAFASLVTAGTPVRLTGQDAARGTFSQRHLTLYDRSSGTPYTPLTALEGQSASFEVHNSPLSEAAALGFEYGYSVQAPDALVLWEAQYGDFINGAQVIVDEFIASGQAKWGLASGLVLLLPHAWEGQGPDHSSGRVERFLQLAAEHNIQVVVPTTAAQYFLLLRRQASTLGTSPRPLVVMTPKSLLRSLFAAARPSQLAGARFQPVIDDGRIERGKRRQVQRLVVCGGKVWADLESHPGRDNSSLAVIRLEQLYPFPADTLDQVIDRYPAAREVIWLQEEPRNMGAWSFVEPLLRELLGNERSLDYIGRTEQASPAEGWSEAHAHEQRRILDAVVKGVASHAA